MWSPFSSTTKRRRFFQAEMFLRISPTDISSHDKEIILSFDACSVNLSLIPQYTFSFRECHVPSSIWLHSVLCGGHSSFLMNPV